MIPQPHLPQFLADCIWQHKAFEVRVLSLQVCPFGLRSKEAFQTLSFEKNVRNAQESQLLNELERFYEDRRSTSDQDSNCERKCEKQAPLLVWNWSNSWGLKSGSIKQLANIVYNFHHPRGISSITTFCAAVKLATGLFNPSFESRDGFFFSPCWGLNVPFLTHLGSQY